MSRQSCYIQTRVTSTNKVVKIELTTCASLGLMNGLSLGHVEQSSLDEISLCYRMSELQTNIPSRTYEITLAAPRNNNRVFTKSGSTLLMAVYRT